MSELKSLIIIISYWNKKKFWKKKNKTGLAFVCCMYDQFMYVVRINLKIQTFICSDKKKLCFFFHLNLLNQVIIHKFD